MSRSRLTSLVLLTLVFLLFTAGRAPAQSLTNGGNSTSAGAAGQERSAAPRKVPTATVPADLQRPFASPKLVPPSRALGPRLSTPPRLTLPPVDVSNLLDEDRRGGDKRSRVGLARSTNISLAQGEWTHSPEGDLWRLNIVSPLAEALRIHFQGLDLPAGAELYIYSKDDPEQIYRYRGTGLYEDGEFWSAPLDGEEAVLELVVPAGVKDRARFKVADVGHIYRKAAGLHATEAGACNLDVACYPDWISTSNAVARIQFHDAQYIYLCSAVMVNNGASDYSPLLLTANHCLATSEVAKTVYATFRSRRATCGATDYVVTHTSMGARVLESVGASVDTTLLLLTGNVSPTLAVFAGWSVDPPALASNITGLHHPHGELQRISFGKVLNESPSHPGMLAVQWDSGITEQGSSGSPLFNADRLVTGVLSGGLSSCTVPTGADYYGKLASAYPTLQTYLSGGVPDDALEQNDSRASAAQVSAQSTYSLVLKPGDDDWFRFTVTGPKLIALSLLSPGNLEVIQMKVYRGQEETPLDFSQGPIPIYEAVTQEYFVHVSMAGSVRGEYSLEFALKDPVKPTVEILGHYLTYRTSDVGLRSNLSGWPGTLWAEWSRTPGFAEPYRTPERPLYGPWANTLYTGQMHENLIPQTQYYFRGLVSTQLHGTVTTPTLSFTTPALPQPVLVSPANGASVQNLFGNLSYTQSSCPVDVYFGTSVDPPLVSTGSLIGGYGTGELQPTTTYYWKVVCRYLQYSASSPIYSFTTRSGFYKMNPAVLNFGTIFFWTNPSLFTSPVRVENKGPFGGTIYTSISGPFTIQSSTCSYVLAGDSCTVVVGFQPLGNGTYNGSLRIEGYPDPAYFVPVTAYVGDITLALSRPQRPGRNSAQSSQSFELGITATEGISGVAALSCTGAPVGMTCSVTPAAVRLAGGPIKATVTVTTAPRSQRLRSRRTQTVGLKVHATIQGMTKSIDLPVQIER